MTMQVNVSDLCMCACVLQVRDRHVQELQTEILTKDGQLQQKDELLQQLQDENDRNIQQKDRQLQQKDRLFQQLRDEKDRNIQAKDQQLQQKDRLFQQLRDEKDQNIQQKDQQIQEKDRQIEVELGPGMCFHEYHAISHLYM